ncbi:L-ectoine synthase [Streptomyces sp. TRM43335]|uniref:L-ectoine synthase n=1 Tax=Streptomyces taklimakanensis TaxID=2569853 RepID=A0A6G2B6F9_9ACTN|nr:ectoine synthase [Streptomyces taklimakanensis]MTE17663.1 L-ectoine synthase [Streptomyces taklimakanensis]
MPIRSLDEPTDSRYEADRGNGTGVRLLTAVDGMGFTVCHPVVRAGTSSFPEYRSHPEARFRLSGSGEITDPAGNGHRITPGVLYALDQHDRHRLRADPDGDMTPLGIFDPPLRGTERHTLHREKASSY